MAVLLKVVTTSQLETADHALISHTVADFFGLWILLISLRLPHWSAAHVFQLQIAKLMQILHFVVLQNVVTTSQLKTADHALIGHMWLISLVCGSCESA